MFSRKTKLVGSLQYENGRLEAPNRFIVNGRYTWKNFDSSSKIRRISGKELVLTYDSKSILDTVGGAELDDVEFKDSFKFETEKYELTSDYATYYYQKKIFLGSNPAYIKSKDSRIHASDGFRIDLNKDNFDRWVSS